MPQSNLATHGHIEGLNVYVQVIGIPLSRERAPTLYIRPIFNFQYKFTQMSAHPGGAHLWSFEKYSLKCYAYLRRKTS